MIYFIFTIGSFKFLFFAFDNVSKHLHSKSFIYVVLDIINCLSEAFPKNKHASGLFKKLFMR